MDSPPILDACLIVKDEALNLPRCLASLEALRPLLGEVHVYDTGSTDDTIAIARAAGCHVAEGYWDDDFARARNASLAMSSAAWALTIDADEEYVGDPAALAGHLVGTGCDVFSLVQQHLDEEGRIAGRTPYAKLVWRDEVRFARAIHEIPTRLDGRTCRIGTIGESVASLRHYGYATERLRAAKAERNAGTALGALSAARARRDPTDVIRSARHAARSLAALGRTDDALVLYAEALAGFAVGTLSWRLTAVDITTTLIASDRVSEAARHLEGLRSAGGDERTLRDVAARLCHRGGGWTDVLRLTAPWLGSPSPDIRERAADLEVLDLRRLAALQAMDAGEVVATLRTLVDLYGESRYADDLAALTA